MALGRFVLLLADLTLLACNVVDDEPHGVDTGGTDGPADQQACLEAANEFFEEVGCLPGYEPQVFYDGGGSVVLLADDPGDIELDSFDALVRVLGRFVTEDGQPRRLGIGHPDLVLRLRRGQQDLVRRLRVR